MDPADVIFGKASNFRKKSVVFMITNMHVNGHMCGLTKLTPQLFQVKNVP